MRRRTSPVQQWVDSIPSPLKSSTPIPIERQEDSTESHKQDTHVKTSKMTVSAPVTVPNSPAITMTMVPTSLPHRLVRDPSLQSDSSHCSSVESLLELRKADPEAILLGLGFGGCSSSPQDNGPLSRIPKRFLQPSKLKGIAINDFVKQQQETSESLDSTSLGYRGLTGSPYVAPSEIVQKIMDRLREHESHEIDTNMSFNNSYDLSYQQQEGRLSVLSPDNRQFLEEPRSKSPDMRNKRMIIGQKSFVFGHDGDLIEVNATTNDTNCNLEANRNISEIKIGENDVPDENQNRSFQKFSNRRLSKQLSFEEDDDDEEEEDNHKQCSNSNLKATSECHSLFDLQSIEEDTQSSSVTDGLNQESGRKLLKSEYLGPRRASDGWFHTGLTPIEKRRYSDGNVFSQKGRKLLGRGSLTRQSRITDEDAENYCNSLEELKGLRREAKEEEEESVEEAPITPNVGNKLCCSHRSYEQLDRDRSSFMKKKDESNYCCDSDSDVEGKREESCKHDKNCRRTKCWKKMEKIMEKNKKLEDMLSKNKQEMAEIRDMLSNVLSVRMEPGF